jgi:hypothetical protein
MVQEKIHTLVASTTRGRYALDDAIIGRELTSGDAIVIFLDGRWISGWVEHGSQLYTIEGYAVGMGVKSGYYFLSDNGGQCGLCVGMQVRLFSE